MKTFKKECLEETKDPIIKFEEKKKVIKFLNAQGQTYVNVQVDGCQVTEGVRCDRLLICKATGDEYFVELKGVDVSNVMEQLERTMSQLSDLKRKNKKISAYIVSSNCASKVNGKRQMFVKKCKEIYGKSFILTIKEKQLVVNL